MSGPFAFAEHHLCHAPAAFYPSPFERAAILSLDLFGEVDKALAAHGSDSGIEKLWTVQYPRSLGSIYGAVTQFLGFQTDSQEYLVMGLASYGDPEYLDDLGKGITLMPDGTFKTDLELFIHHLGREKWYSAAFEKTVWARTGPGRRDHASSHTHVVRIHAVEPTLRFNSLEMRERSLVQILYLAAARPPQN